LVPRQIGSGGKVTLHGIRKRGDTYLRTLLVHGARGVLRVRTERATWAERLQSRKPLNVAVVAQANKTARTIWAVLARGVAYGRTHISVRPV
jgi:transposase